MGSGGEVFGELARTSVLSGIASDKWLDLAARLKILFYLKKKGTEHF